jgi:hypothetical protein
MTDEHGQPPCLGVKARAAKIKPWGNDDKRNADDGHNNDKLYERQASRRFAIHNTVNRDRVTT